MFIGTKQNLLIEHEEFRVWSSFFASFILDPDYILFKVLNIRKIINHRIRKMTMLQDQA